jgi:hypothetical protein
MEFVQELLLDAFKTKLPVEGAASNMDVTSRREQNRVTARGNDVFNWEASELLDVLRDVTAVLIPKRKFSVCVLSAGPNEGFQIYNIIVWHFKTFDFIRSNLRNRRNDIFWTCCSLLCLALF